MLHDVWPIVRLTLVVAAFAVGLAGMIGLPLGVWLGRATSRYCRWLWVATYSGMALPPVIVGLVVYLLLSRSGPLGSLGWLYTPRAMIVAQVLLGLPFVIGITATSVAAVPRDLYFQLRTLGATEWQARWTLLLEARAGVILALATAFGRSISEVGAVLMVGGNIHGQTRVLTTAIMLQTNQGRFALALLLGGALLLLALVVNFVMLRFHGRSTT